LYGKREKVLRSTFSRFQSTPPSHTLSPFSQVYLQLWARTADLEEEEFEDLVVLFAIFEELELLDKSEGVTLYDNKNNDKDRGLKGKRKE
jgi:hypothetical protein